MRMTIPQVMAYLDCTRRGVDNLIHDGLLTPLDDLRFDPEEVEECRRELNRRHEALLEIYRINEELDLGDESYG